MADCLSDAAREIQRVFTLRRVLHIRSKVLEWDTGDFTMGLVQTLDVKKESPCGDITVVPRPDTRLFLLSGLEVLAPRRVRTLGPVVLKHIPESLLKYPSIAADMKVLVGFAEVLDLEY